ncbi:MAG: sigma-70 family RNA polymerase sigma factor [Myxococcota bacterium]
MAQAAPSERFDALFREHRGFVFRSLRHLGSPPEATEDLTQEVFITLYRRSSDFDASRSARAWLFTTARNVLANYRRVSARAQRKLKALADAPNEPTRTFDPQRLETARTVEQLLLQMDEPKRLVLLLADAEGLTGPELAAALDIPLNTAYSRLRSARSEFERLVAPLDGSTP